MSKLIDIMIVPNFDPMGTGVCYYNLVAIRECAETILDEMRKYIKYRKR